jgi:hypothetical protein
LPPKQSDEAQESGIDSSSTAFELSTLPEPAIVGPLNPNPEFGIIQDPPKWKELESMDFAERDRLVVRRANYYLQVWLIPDSRSFYPARRKALQEGNLSVDKPSTPLKLDLTRLNNIFPIKVSARWLLDSNNKYRSNYREKLENKSRYKIDEKSWEEMGTVAKVDDVYKENIGQFKRTQLCERLKQLIAPLFMQTTITKIVVFGLSTLIPFSDVRNTFWTPRLHAQHAALEAIRSVWEEHRPSETTEMRIFLQDLQYCELDKQVVEIHKMEFVNCSFGHQMG